MLIILQRKREYQVLIYLILKRKLQFLWNYDNEAVELIAFALHLNATIINSHVLLMFSLVLYYITKGRSSVCVCFFDKLVTLDFSSKLSMLDVLR